MAAAEEVVEVEVVVVAEVDLVVVAVEVHRGVVPVAEVDSGDAAVVVVEDAVDHLAVVDEEEVAVVVVEPAVSKVAKQSSSNLIDMKVYLLLVAKKMR